MSILRYHAIVDEEWNDYTFPAISLSPFDFGKHVRFFSIHYNIITLDQFVNAVRNKIPYPPNSIIFTFDDGYVDNLIAAQILNKYKASGTFFINVDPIKRKSLFWISEITYLILNTYQNTLKILIGGSEKNFTLHNQNERWKTVRELVKIIKSNDLVFREKIRTEIKNQLGEKSMLNSIENLMLSTDDLQKMIQLGMDVGSHTLTHLNLPNAAPEDAKREISESKMELEKLVGKPINHFSYPNSGPYKYFTQEIREYVVQAGYLSACTSHNGFADYHSDLFTLHRIRTVPDLAEVVHQLEWERFFSI